MSDAWTDIVGIDLDEWMRADTGEQIRWLAFLRDHPMPSQGLRPLSEGEDEFVVLDGFGRIIKTYRA